MDSDEMYTTDILRGSSCFDYYPWEFFNDAGTGSKSGRPHKISYTLSDDSAYQSMRSVSYADSYEQAQKAIHKRDKAVALSVQPYSFVGQTACRPDNSNHIPLNTEFPEFMKVCADSNNHSAGRKISVDLICSGCERAYSSKFALRRHQSSKTACRFRRRDNAKTLQRTPDKATKDSLSSAKTPSERFQHNQLHSSEESGPSSSIHGHLHISRDSMRSDLAGLIPFDSSDEESSQPDLGIGRSIPANFDPADLGLGGVGVPADDSIAETLGQFPFDFVFGSDPKEDLAKYIRAPDITRELAQQTTQDRSIKHWMNEISTPGVPFCGGINSPRGSDSEEDTVDASSEILAWTDYAETMPEWDPHGEIIVPMKREYVQRILASFKQPRQLCESQEVSDEESSPSIDNGNGKRAATSSSGGSQSGRGPAKRRKQDSSNGNDGGEEGDSPQQKAPPTFTKDGSENMLLLACPFVKRYPGCYRKCYSHTFKDVARVKYHLQRSPYHRIPIYCPTCSENFKDEAMRDLHVRAANCPKKPQRKWEGISAIQREKLSKRTAENRTTTKRWNEIYKILFPGDPLPKSPYIDLSLSEELRAFRDHMQSEGPTIWNEVIQRQLPTHLQQHLDELQSLHATVLPEAIDALFQSWSSRFERDGSTPLRSVPTPSREDLEVAITPRNGGRNSPPNSDSALGTSVAGTTQNENEHSIPYNPSDGPQQLTLAQSVPGTSSSTLNSAPPTPQVSFPSPPRPNPVSESNVPDTARHRTEQIAAPVNPRHTNHIHQPRATSGILQFPLNTTDSILPMQAPTLTANPFPGTDFSLPQFPYQLPPTPIFTSFPGAGTPTPQAYNASNGNSMGYPLTGMSNNYYPQTQMYLGPNGWFPSQEMPMRTPLSNEVAGPSIQAIPYGFLDLHNTNIHNTM